MTAEIKIFVSCSHCLDGTRKQEYKELEHNSDGEQVLVDKVGVNFVSYELEPEQLEDRTIAEFVASKACRKCRSKALKELIR